MSIINDAEIKLFRTLGKLNYFFPIVPFSFIYHIFLKSREHASREVRFVSFMTPVVPRSIICNVLDNS